MMKFSSLCGGNPLNKIRGSDRWGQGYYGAPRDGGSRRHLGVDVECEDGATVFAPFDAVLNGKTFPYNDPKKEAINDGVNISVVGVEGLCFKLWYVKPDNYFGAVKKGERIGTMSPMQSVYPGITSHIHVQLFDKSDPTQYIKRDDEC